MSGQCFLIFAFIISETQESFHKILEMELKETGILNIFQLKIEN